MVNIFMMETRSFIRLVFKIEMKFYNALNFYDWYCLFLKLKISFLKT